MLLAEEPAAVQVRDDNGATALHLAAACHEPSAEEVVRLLVCDYAAAVAAKDRSGVAPIHHAAAAGNTAAMQVPCLAAMRRTEGEAVK